jgi:hypothetical protein
LNLAPFIAKAWVNFGMGKSGKFLNWENQIKRIFELGKFLNRGRF